MPTSGTSSAVLRTLPAASVQELRSNLHGTLLLPGDAGYDQSRQIFNAMIDRHPAAIAQCQDANDVAATLRFAAGLAIPVSIRGGGHNVAGHAIVHDGIVIDLSPMKQLEVDTERRVAKAGAGLRLGEFVTGTEAYGLVSPTGTVSDTGIAGLTLGAGFGYLCGKYGLAVDNVLGFEVVLADGSIVRADANDHPDLYWALRGGSGNFGVVTTFELQLYPLPAVLGGLILHPFPRATEVLRLVRDTAAAAPDELIIYSALVTGPDGNKAVGIIPCWCGDLTEGERVLRPLREFGPPIADMVGPIPYSTMNTLVDAAVPNGLRHYWKQNLLTALNDDVIDAVIERFARVPSPRSVVLFDDCHGAARRVAPDATAFPHRDCPHSLVMLGIWDDPAQDEENIAWIRDLAEATRPWTTGGVYVNESWDEKPRAAFGQNYDRLAQIKAIYDPTNLFRQNTNIPPAAQS